MLLQSVRFKNSEFKIQLVTVSKLQAHVTSCMWVIKYHLSNHKMECLPGSTNFGEISLPHFYDLLVLLTS